MGGKWDQGLISETGLNRSGCRGIRLDLHFAATPAPLEALSCMDAPGFAPSCEARCVIAALPG